MEELAHYAYGFILEVGAADGYISYLMKGQGKDVITSDISADACRRAKRFKLNLLICDGRHLPFKDDTFDCIVAGETLEHIKNMGYILAELQRVSKKRIIISLPHEHWKGDRTHVWDIMWRGVMYKGDKLNFDPNLGFSILIMDKKF